MAIQNTLVSNANTLVFESIGDNAITSIIICNINPFNELNPVDNVYTITLYAITAAETDVAPTYGVLAKHTIVNSLPITAGETLSLDQEKLILSNGDIIVAVSDGVDQLAVTISTLVV
jgi:hypothetical protein